VPATEGAFLLEPKDEFAVFAADEVATFRHVEMSLRCETDDADAIVRINQTVLFYPFLKFELGLRFNYLCLYYLSEPFLLGLIVTFESFQIVFSQHLDQLSPFRNKLH
jgi:hypothetical protein